MTPKNYSKHRFNYEQLYDDSSKKKCFLGCATSPGKRAPLEIAAVRDSLERFKMMLCDIKP